MDIFPDPKPTVEDAGLAELTRSGGKPRGTVDVFLDPKNTKNDCNRLYYIYRISNIASFHDVECVDIPVNLFEKIYRFLRVLITYSTGRY